MKTWRYDASNSEFWDYLCGVNAAQANNFDLTTKEGIESFDSWYFKTYPYLKDFLDDATAGADSILEIGLGLGSVARYLATSKEYFGMDFLKPVIDFNRSKFENRKLSGELIHSSILDTKQILIKNSTIV